ncbi:GRIP and coiled-coil domain-containing protein 2-like [Stegodyphus dumicola]|uniref:GRIP and coiled-coil domain-containing protein 2-like n=1 Tax=Stegodyphus dumicola TaxID=202533 RepID=UPI0015A8A8D4|nr:GRIP and coiled-coil domain-containing protein 2-like [Stegodyphus dumicola]XP_035208945.1 GRIP and coiled-coil domain-containing protein 2-like [Stegodyphus dumicola]
MADAVTEIAQEHDSEKKKKIPLEERSKDDLVKLVRKHLSLLQKSKEKYDELNKKCLAIEQEKESAVAQQLLSQKEFQEEVEKLQKSIENLTAENKKCIEEKASKILKLKEELEAALQDKTSFISLLSEKDERMQCLTMQLDTVKATCLCFQEELSKLQKQNKEMTEEIQVLTEARDAALQSLKTQGHASSDKSDNHDSLLQESCELNKKYAICIEENCVLSSKIEKLDTEIRNLKYEKSKLNDDLSEVQGKYASLKLRYETDNNDYSILITDNQQLQAKIRQLQNEIDDLKETMEVNQQEKESNLQSIKDVLEAENRSLSVQVKEMETKITETASALETSEKQRIKLEDEVKNLCNSLKMYDDFKGGFEHAVLQGAATESLVLSVNDKNINEGMIDTSKKEVATEVHKDIQGNVYTNSGLFSDLYATESTAGIEFALLEGGDVFSHFEEVQNQRHEHTENESDEINKLQIFAEKLKLENQNLVLHCEELEKEKAAFDYEVSIMKRKIVEFSDLLQETQSENESLKLKLEYQNSEKSRVLEGSYKIIPVHTNAGVNTESDLIEVHLSNGQTLDTDSFCIEEKITNLIKKVTFLQSEGTNCFENCALISQELKELSLQIRNFTRKMEDIEIAKLNIETRSELVEKQNLELSEKLDKKCAELNEFNLQLELLIIGIKQGVRQKTTASSYQTERELTENMAQLKLLLDDLLVRCNSNAIKVQTLESDIENILIQKQNIEDELMQIRELNYFLEHEARELRDEVEQLKCVSKMDAENYESPEIWCDASFQKCSPELYSIEEINEYDDKSFNLNEVENDNTKPFSVDSEVNTDVAESKIQNCLVQHVSVQVGDPLSSSKYEDTFHLSDINENISSNHQTNMEEKLQITVKELKDKEKIIETLTDDTNNLKSLLNDKSNLVERIHCEMDSLLSKIEELTVELHEKDCDVNNYMCLNLDLKRKLQHYESVQQDAFKHVRASVDELKDLKTSLNSEMQTAFIFYNENMNVLKYSLTDVLNSHNLMVEKLKQKCLHLETNITEVIGFFNKITEDIELWLAFVNGQFNQNSNDQIFSKKCDISSLECTFQEELSSFRYSQIENKCIDSDCCTILNNVKNLNELNVRFLSTLYHYFNNISNDAVSKELNDCKINIIPTLEKTIKNLENKCAVQSELQNSNDVSNNQQVAECGNEIDDLKNQLAETEIKMNKFKQIALKMKKELTETKKQYNEVMEGKEKCDAEIIEIRQELEKVSSDQYRYVQNYQSLQNEYDKLQDENEVQKIHAKQLEEDLANKLLELNTYKEKVLDLESQLTKSQQMYDTSVSVKEEIERKCADLESKVIILESKNVEKVQKIQELEAEIAKHLKEYNSVVEENKGLKLQLEYAEKEEKKKNLLDLEMADYERSILELNSQLQKKENEISELQIELKSHLEKIQSLQEELKSTETLKDTEEKRAENLKEVLEKTKTELTTVREHDEELKCNLSSLRTQLEIMTQQEEKYKLQLSELSSEVQHLKDVIKTSSENHQRITRSLESRISSQKQEILIAHKEVESVKQEFENYKIRVHSVLKQQKSSTPTFMPIEPDLKEKLETINEKLKIQVKDLSEKLTAMNLEYEALQEEHDNLLQRYNKAIDDNEKKDSEWHQRLQQINFEKNRLRAAQEELASQHLLQNEMLVSTYKKQIKIMSEEHKRIVNDLQKQLDAADVEIARLQRDHQKSQSVSVTPSASDNPVPFDILSQERQEGEGSENTEDINTPIRHLSLATIPTSGFLPFEKLLQSPPEPGTPASFISNQDCEKLIADLNAANKKIEHLSEVLNDSESTNLRLSEQVRVLKEEVRRLERNKEREQHAENLEYLKNVFIKFSTLQACSEKAMLIPVLTTMLKLSPDEQQQLKNIAGDIDPNDTTSSAGWGSYLHRWSGLA